MVGDRPFVRGIAEAFDLGSADSITVRPMAGSANRLWRFSSPRGEFVVKELSHDGPEELDGRREAARFERQVFGEGDVLLPEPIEDRHGELVIRSAGSRGAPSTVRAHRWIDGLPGSTSTSPFVTAAGASLRTIQRAGGRWSTRAAGSLRWWHVDPSEVLARLRRDGIEVLQDAASTIVEALAVVDRAERQTGPWVYTHTDHKPENALVVGDRVAVLDWDECGHCHPRLEAVEAALRWADPSQPRRERFEAFVAGYGELGSLTDADFGKWLAALLGWFSFQGRRALGDWATETADERAAAAAMARSALDSLRSSLASLTEWTAWC